MNNEKYMWNQNKKSNVECLVRLMLRQATKIFSKHYSLIIMLFFIIVVLISRIIIQDNLIVTLNDSMDSNIPIYKMFRDNKLFWRFSESIPFLGGDISRSDYRVEFSVASWMYMIFDTLTAYYVVYALKILCSGMGFCLLAKVLKEYNITPWVDVNVWCLCGVVYAFLGNWTHASIGFASLPWWVVFFYLLYRTNKIRYIILMLLFILTTSFTMLALFCLFYALLFIVAVAIKNRRINVKLIIGFCTLSGAYVIANLQHVWQGINSSKSTIKSLKQFGYNESIRVSLAHFRDAFLGRGAYYHAGGSTLRYFVIPVCTAFLIYLIFLLYKKNVEAKAAITYFIIYAIILFNNLTACFDYDHLFRRILSFATGFGFSRFLWLNPFLWFVLFAMVCCYVYTVIKKRTVAYVCVFIAVAAIVIDPFPDSRSSMYNELYYNISYLTGRPIEYDANHEWTWREYYSENLFNDIKEDISYNGEWSVAYGVEPSVLQYNGIRTLDGYYSNYSLEYHDLFQRLIQPELDIDEEHTAYWNSSAGHRAYVYSPLWEFCARKNLDIDEAPLYINPETFHEMGGKYVFSRVTVSNADELNLLLLGKWISEDSPYMIYVYASGEGR